MGKIETEKFLDLVNTIPDTAVYIEQNIIPEMMIRRGRTEPLDSTEITKKLFGIESKKPGEAFELIWGELAKHGHNLTPAVASEIADITYYTSQINCPVFMRDPSPLFEGLGVTMEQARRFCILKYTIRMKIGDEKYHKKTENNVLKHYLNRHFLDKSA